MEKTRRLIGDPDLALGLLLSIVLGGGVGLVLSRPIGHVLLGSAIGVALLAAYLLAYSLGTIWLLGVERGLLMVSAFAWCIILSAWLGSHPAGSSVVSFFTAKEHLAFF